MNGGSIPLAGFAARYRRLGWKKVAARYRRAAALPPERSSMYAIDSHPNQYWGTGQGTASITTANYSDCSQTRLEGEQ